MLHLRRQYSISFCNLCQAVVSKYGCKTFSMACLKSQLKPHRTFMGRVRVTCMDQGTASETCSWTGDIRAAEMDRSSISCVWKPCESMPIRVVRVIEEREEPFP